MKPATQHENIERYDIYRGIHKAVRAFMSDTMTRLSSVDLSDVADAGQVLQQVKELADFCEGHVAHENEFVHTAMEARQPGSTATTAGDHVHHGEDFALIRAQVAAVEQAHGREQERALCRLQRTIALFIADNFAHMNVEETHNNSVLWAHYSDREIAAIEHALVASLPPEEGAVSVRWMLVGMNPLERAELLGGIQQVAPAPVFQGMLEIARQTLSARDWKKLQEALSLPQPLAA